MTPGESVLHRHLGLPICSIPVGTSGAGQDTEGCVSPHSGKNHPEERDEVSCLANGLTRTSIGHQDARPEVRCSRGQCSLTHPHRSSCAKPGIKEAGEAPGLVVA